MMKIPLHDQLCTVLGSRNCYFTPPATIKMTYPCIVYQITNQQMTYADNISYFSSTDYLVTIMDYDPDSELSRKLVESMRYCTFDRSYVVNGLYHFAYRLSFDGPRIEQEGGVMQ